MVRIAPSKDERGGRKRGGMKGRREEGVRGGREGRRKVRSL